MRGALSLSATLVAAVLLLALSVCEGSQWNVGGVIRMFNSKQGLKKEWEKSGYPCVSSAATRDGTTAVVQMKPAELCAVDTESGKASCYRTEGDLVGPVYARHIAGSTFVYSTASDSYTFEASTGVSTPFNLPGKSADAYMTAFGSSLYIPLPSCASGIPEGVTCVEQANAVGGVLVGLARSGILTFVRTSTEVISSSGDSHTLNGDFKEWQFDKDVLGVRTSNAYTILSATDLSVEHSLAGSWLYGSMTSIQFNQGRERTVALESASALEIHDVKASGTKKVAQSSIADPGPILGLVKARVCCLDRITEGVNGVHDKLC